MRRPALPSGRWSRLAPVATFVVAAAITALVALALIRLDGDGDEVAALADGPSTAARVTLREAPADDARAVGTLPAGTAIEVEARSTDGRSRGTTSRTPLPALERPRPAIREACGVPRGSGRIDFFPRSFGP